MFDRVLINFTIKHRGSEYSLNVESNNNDTDKLTVFPVADVCSEL